MAFSELEIARCEKILSKYVESARPPPELRAQVDLAFRVHGQSVEIFEIRPRWDDPNDKVECPIAKATFVKRGNLWRVYWQRADLRWHRYQPEPEAASLEHFLEIVERDEYACFFG